MRSKLFSAFGEAEYRERLARAREHLARAGFDGCVSVAPEHLYYLGGYDAWVSVNSPQALIFRTGGAIARVADDATAASHRDAPYMWHPIASWFDPAETDAQIGWAREGSEAMRPFKTGGVYLNFEPDEGEQHVRAGFSPAKYARLVELKDKYDPENLFRLNQNIAPSGAAR